MVKLYLSENETLVRGKSSEKARSLLSKAESLGYPRKAVRSVSVGYIAPKDVARAPDAPVDERPAEELAPADDQTPGGLFDPSEHGVRAVREYLTEADEDERERVLAAERDGKARSSLLPDDNEGEDS